MAGEWENFIAAVLDAQEIAYQRQVWIAPYRADFVLVGLDIVIEVDDRGHNNAEGHRHDRAQDEAYRACGFDVIRIPEADLDDRLEDTITELLRTVNKRIQGYGGMPKWIDLDELFEPATIRRMKQVRQARENRPHEITSNYNRPSRRKQKSTATPQAAAPWPTMTCPVCDRLIYASIRPATTERSRCLRCRAEVVQPQKKKQQKRVFTRQKV